MHKLLINN